MGVVVLEDKDDVFFFGVDGFDYCVGEVFLVFVLVVVGLFCLYCEYGIE